MTTKKINQDKFETFVKDIKYIVKDIDEYFYENENNKKAIESIIKKIDSPCQIRINEEDEVEKAVVLFCFDISKKEIIIEDLKKYINDEIAKPIKRIQLIGVVDHLDEKMILSKLIKDNKSYLCKEIKCTTSKFNFDAIFMPKVDNNPIEFKATRLNSLIFPEPNTNLNVMPAIGEKKKDEICGYVFVASLEDLVEIYNRVGDELFSCNLRYGIKDGMGLEDSMRNTLLNEPQMFWYYNNGITIVTQIDNTDLENAGKVVLSKKWEDVKLNFSIINGAQTISTASRIFYGNGEDEAKVKAAKEKAKVLLRIITVKDLRTKSNITIALNRQKPIKSEDIAFQSKFVSTFNDYMASREMSKKDYLYILKRGEPIYDENTIELPLFAQLVYTCLMNPTEARNEGPSKLYYSDQNSEIINTRYFRDEFSLASSNTNRDIQFAKYYNAIFWAYKLYNSLNKELKVVEDKDCKTILANNKWSFIAYALKSIQGFSGKETELEEIDYSNFVGNEEVIISVREYMDEFVEIVNSKYDNYVPGLSKTKDFWNNICEAEKKPLFTSLYKAKEVSVSKNDFENYLKSNSFFYDKSTNLYIAEVDSDVFTDVSISVEDDTFDISAMILNIYSDGDELDKSDQEKYDLLIEKILDIFKNEISDKAYIERENDSLDESAFIMIKGAKLDTTLVGRFYSYLSKDYKE